MVSSSVHWHSNGQNSLNQGVKSRDSTRGYAQRGRGFSYTGSFSLKGHIWLYSSVPTSGLSFGIVWNSLRKVHD